MTSYYTYETEAEICNKGVLRTLELIMSVLLFSAIPDCPTTVSRIQTDIRDIP